MVWYQMLPSIYTLWVPLIIIYTALTIAFVSAAINIYYRDVGQALPDSNSSYVPPVSIASSIKVAAL